MTGAKVGRKAMKSEAGQNSHFASLFLVASVKCPISSKKDPGQQETGANIVLPQSKYLESIQKTTGATGAL